MDPNFSDLTVPVEGRNLEMMDVRIQRSQGPVPIIRVLTSDSSSHGVNLRKISRSFGLLESLNIRDLGQRDAHGDSELNRGNVDIADGFSARVFHLETGIQFKEEVFRSGRDK